MRVRGPSDQDDLQGVAMDASDLSAQARINLALSMIARTTATPERRLELVEMALLGATVQDLMDMERGAR